MQFTLKIVSAVVLSGEIHTAGSIVSVDEATAKELLRRGKAEPHAELEADALEDESSSDEQPKPPVKTARASAGKTK